MSSRTRRLSAPYHSPLTSSYAVVLNVVLIGNFEDHRKLGVADDRVLVRGLKQLRTHVRKYARTSIQLTKEMMNFAQRGHSESLQAELAFILPIWEQERYGYTDTASYSNQAEKNGKPPRAPFWQPGIPSVAHGLERQKTAEV